MTLHTRPAAARAFVRTLNILLKFARMYDFGHPRTAKQYETAWMELRTALGSEADNEAGLLLGVSGDQLLLDGTPLESAAAEKSFARMLSSAGIASIHFSPKVTQASLARFVRGFPTGTGAKPIQLAEQLKAALQGDPHIHVNEVCFVPADSAVAKSTIAAQIAARTIGLSSEKSDELFNDPERLLQLIVAAEGKKGERGSGSGTGTGSCTGSGSGGGPNHGGHGSGGSGNGPAGGENRSRNRNNFEYGAGDSSEIVRGMPEGTHGGGTGSGSYVAGSVSPVHGVGGRTTSTEGSDDGTWNIVGGSGSGEGVPLTPDVGGFWLNKEDAKNPRSGSQKSGAKVVGGVPVPTSGNTNEDNSVQDGIPGAGTQMFGNDGTHAGSGGSRSDSRNAGGSSVRVWKAPNQGDEPNGPPSRWGHASSEIRRSRPARANTGSMSVETGLMTLQEDELQGILQLLGQIARTSETSKDKLDPISFQSRLSTLPRRARFTVSQALSALAAQAPVEMSEKSTLLKLAEHIAIRFALESYERGDVQVNTVRQMMDEMSQELDGLRKIMGVYEEKMARHGIQMQSHVDVLAQQFWGQVGDDKKKMVLESSDAWCVPPARVREYVEKLIETGEPLQAESILRNYASCITNKTPEQRRQTAMGLAELASLYAKGGDRLLTDVIRQVGVELTEERDSELQSLVGAAFVRLSQEATTKRSYPAIQRAIELVEYVETERPGLGKNLRPRIGIEERLPEFIEEAVKSGNVASGLRDLIRRMPIAASDHLAGRFSRSGFRDDCDLLVTLMEVLGPEGLQNLQKRLRKGDATQAIEVIGILARLDADSVEQVLPGRMSEWKRTAHDRIVRQIASSGAPNSGRLLLQIFDHLDALICPLAIDEIGMSGEQTADMRLLRLAEGDLPKDGTNYLRLKAIEALGRLRTPGAEAVLRKIAEARKAFRWANPNELRLVASQAMEKIDPEWVRSFIPHSGLSVAELSIEPLDADPNSSAIRQRRYARLRLEHFMPAMTTSLKENYRLDIPEMTLGGGVAICEQSLHPGSVIGMKLNMGQKPVKAQTIVRDANTQARAFEVVDIDLEERSKLRKLLVQMGNIQKQTTPKERSRRGTRTIVTSQT